MPLNGFLCEVTTATMPEEGELPNFQNLRHQLVEHWNLTRIEPLEVQPQPSTFEVVATTPLQERTGYTPRDRDNASDNYYKYLDTLDRLTRLNSRGITQSQEASDYRMMLNTLYYHLTACDLRILINDHNLQNYLDETNPVS